MKLVILVSLLLSFFACSAFAILSPGYGVGATTYDWLSNGSMKKTVCLDAQHGVHVIWTYRIMADQNSRRAYYNFRDETGAWAFVHSGVPVSPDTARYPVLSLLSDGRLVAAFNCSNWGFVVYVGNSRCVFQGALRWPGLAVGGYDVIHVFASSLTDSDHYYSRSTDLGQNWSPWTLLCDNGLSEGFFAMAARGSKVAVVWPDSLDNDVWLRESTDDGVT